MTGQAGDDRIDTALRFVDLHHQGKPHVIGVGVVEVDGGVAIVDPGPGSGLPALREALRQTGHDLRDIRAVLLTHIHLDHAGATGSLVQGRPDIPVYVHARGARHLADPTKLIASATRLFGDRMEALWGPCLAVPAHNIRALEGGERLTVGERRLEVAYTPGHASHHVAYLDAGSGTAFVGDAGGGRLNGGPIVLPATPPPEADVEAVVASFARIVAWQPARIILTHFGATTDLDEHGDQLETRLRAWAADVRDSLTNGQTDDERISDFVARVKGDLETTMDQTDAAAALLGAPPYLSWLGLARYWRKRAEVSTD